MLDSGACSWWDTPPQPGSAAARAEQRRTRRQERRLADSPEGRKIEYWIEDLQGEVSYGPEG